MQSWTMLQMYNFGKKKQLELLESKCYNSVETFQTMLLTIEIGRVKDYS